jgi:MFS family permease
VTAPPLRRNRDFLLLWSGQALSVLGSRVSAVAYPLLVLEMTGSPSTAAFVGFAGTAPYLLLQLPAGALADRYNRRRLMIACDSVRALALLSVVVALVAGELTVSQLMVAAFVEGAMFVAFSAAESSAVVHIVPPEQVAMALSQNEARMRAAGMAGPPLGGILFGLARSLPFLADAVSYLASLGTLLAIRREFESAPERSHDGLVHEIRLGVRWLLGHAFMRDTALLVAGSNMLFQALVLVLIVLAKDHGASSGTVGLMLAGSGVGGVAGSLAAPWLQRRISPRTVVIGANWVWAALFPLFAVLDRPLALGAVFAAAAFVGPAWNVVLGAYQLALVPDELRGRVSSVDLLIAFGAIPVGSLLAAGLLSAFSPSGAAAVLAGIMLAVAIAAVAAPSIRHAPPLSGAGPRRAAPASAEQRA